MDMCIQSLVVTKQSKREELKQAVEAYLKEGGKMTVETEVSDHVLKNRRWDDNRKPATYFLED